MPIIQVTFPSTEEEARTRKFQVHKNYLGAIHQYVETTYGVGEPPDFSGMLKVQSDMRAFSGLQRREPAEPEALRRYLMMSWASGAQLRVHEGVEATILPYANAWAPVHSYFAVYMSCVTWLSAQGHADASDHGAVLAAISNQVASRSLFPTPWSASLGGCPEVGDFEWSGLAKDADPAKHVEVLENPSIETFWPRYGKMLETTRNRKLKSRYVEWCRQNGRKNTKRTKSAPSQEISLQRPSSTSSGV